MSSGYITKYLKKKDGLQIFFRFWAGSKDMPVLILLHGIGSHSMRFDAFTRYFQKRRYNIYAFDFAGFGKSQSFKGHIESINTYVNETLAMVKLSKMEFPDNKKFIVGEDIGGTVALYFTKHYPQLVDSLVLLSPCAKIRWHIPFQKSLNIMFSAVINKFQQINLPFTNEMMTRDFKMQKMLQNDELDLKIVTAKFYFVFMEALKKINRIAQQVDIPVYILQAGNDMIVNTESVKEVFNNLRSPIKELNVLPDFYHSLVLDRDREIVFLLIEKWIQKVLFFSEVIKEKPE